MWLYIQWTYIWVLWLTHLNLKTNCIECEEVSVYCEKILKQKDKLKNLRRVNTLAVKLLLFYYHPQIRLDAPSIYMPKLKSALPLPPSVPHAHDPHHQNIYQLCACANGKLFLAPPHGACAAREESLICRW